MLLKRIIFFFLTILIATLQSTPFFSLSSSNINFLMYYHESKQGDYWNSFHTAAFEIPLLLHYASISKMPVILVVPEHEGYSPLDDQAPIIEGARVALAWASAYYRFAELGNVDVKIITYKSNQNLTFSQILAAASTVLELRCKDNSLKTAELAIENRMYNFDQLKITDNTPEIVCRSWSVQESTSHIIPLVTALPHKKEIKRILIAGGAGFIGSHLAQELIHQGYQVIILDNFLCCDGSNLNEIKNQHNLDVIYHDVTQEFTLEGPIDYIVHLASAPSPAFYYTKPRETLQAGLHGTKNLLELARQKNARFLFASSSEVYGNPTITPQPETYAGHVSPVGKRSQYDQSKRAGETLIKLYYEKYGIDVRIVRIFNTYGPGMNINDGRVVTNFIKQMLEDKPLTIYDNGKQTRSFAYVSDTVDGIIKVLFSDKLTKTNSIQDRVFNIGNPEEFTINELAKKINELSYHYFHKHVLISHIEQPDPYDPRQRCPNISKIKNVTGFSPQITLDEGLEKTFLFFLNSLKSK